MGFSEVSFGWGCDPVLDEKQEQIWDGRSERRVLLKFVL